MYTIYPKITSTAIDPEQLQNKVGEHVSLHGTIYKIRQMSGFAFVLLQTGRN